MTLQIATSTQNARLDAVEADIGASPVLKIRTGTQPLDCATADSGTVVMSITLSSDWMDVASGGTKSFSDLPGTFTASGTGVGDHFRLYKSDGITCMMQGSVTLTGGGGNITMSNNNVVSGFTYTVNAFTLADNNA